ncbi:MAG: hypothetical protein WCC06_04205 [Candidatus Aminicenantales bacterium]
MDKEISLIQISEEDIRFIEKELAKSRRPFSLRELTEKLAYLKTASQRIQEVKKYDPSCVYEIGDSIYKEYDEPLPLNSKYVEHFTGAVVLKVINKNYYKDFNCEMLEVDYTGGGIFRKYIDFMKKTKTQVLLPSNIDRNAKAPETMGKEEDPRLSELPMTDKDLKSLAKNLRSALSKSPLFFNWNDYWQLTESPPEISEERIKEIENLLSETRISASTEDLIQKFFGLETSHNEFDFTCLWLNSVLETKYKKDFLQVSPFRWGKWHLKTIVNSLPNDLPLSAEPAVLPEFDVEEKIQVTLFHSFPLKIYLTWREILSGGVKIPKSFNKELSVSREYILTDAEEGKNYTVYYYPSLGFLLGLQDFFISNNVPQGTSMTLERKGPSQFNFWLKKSKKKLSVAKLAYDIKEDKLLDNGEAFTLALPNKIIYLERETLERLLALYSQRENLNLKELLILVFRNYSLQSNNYSLHYLRAYHLADVLKRTTQEDVEFTLLNSLEFSKSDKKKGIFFYQEAPEIKEEAKPEAPAEIREEIPGEVLPEEVVGEKVPLTAETRAEILFEQPLPPVKEITKREKPPLPEKEKKEKPFKKKKIKIEGERVPRPRKSVKRVIEEKIELEESEQEALYALKEEAPIEETAREIQAKEKKEPTKPATSEAPSFGMFAEKLKSALSKKKKEEKEK